MTPIRTSLAALALAAIAAPALAQSTPTTNNATNINPQGSPGTYAPRLPEPQAGEDATVRRYLEDARRALATGRTGEAQEALEHAETRLLDRSVAPSRINDPSRNPQANAVAQARLALGAGDRAGAMRIIDASLGARPVAAAPPPPPLPYPPVPAPPGCRPGWSCRKAGPGWRAPRSAVTQWLRPCCRASTARTRTMRCARSS